MKHRKTKLGLSLKVISILSCVAILAVGFANWFIIRVQEPAPITEGAFQVYPVSNKYITFTATNSGNWLSNDKIIFGKTTGVTPTWLMASGVDDAVLSTKLSFTVTLADQENGTNATSDEAYLDDMLQTITVTLTPANATATNGFVSAVTTNNYLATPTVSAKYGTSKENVTTDLTNNVATAYNSATGVITMTFNVPVDQKQIFVDVTFGFNWGQAFNGQNPYAYYNGQTYTDQLATTAYTALDNLSKLSSSAYTIEIDSTLKAN